MCEPWCPPTKEEIEAENKWIKEHPEQWKKMWKKEWWMPWIIGAIAFSGPIFLIILAVVSHYKGHVG